MVEKRRGEHSLKDINERQTVGFQFRITPRQREAVRYAFNNFDSRNEWRGERLGPFRSENLLIAHAVREFVTRLHPTIDFDKFPLPGEPEHPFNDKKSE
jgi:hypothetical protein